MENSDLFKCERIRTAEGFIEEFFGIIDTQSDRKQIFDKVVFLLSILSVTRIDVLCATRPKQFESLKGERNMYAMRVQTSSNLRILFSCEADSSILLHSFLKKAGKKASDYSGHLPVARERLNQV